MIMCIMFWFSTSRPKVHFRDRKAPLTAANSVPSLLVARGFLKGKVNPSEPFIFILASWNRAFF